MPESIYITGCGVVSALGIGQQEFRTGLLQGRSALNSCLHHISTVHNIPCAEVFPSDEELKETMQLPDIPYTRASLMGIMAAREAVANAALNSFAKSLPNYFIVGDENIDDNFGRLKYYIRMYDR